MILLCTYVIMQHRKISYYFCSPEQRKEYHHPCIGKAQVKVMHFLSQIFFFINSGQLYFTFYVCCCLICCPVIIWMHVMISVWAKMTILGAFLWMDSRMSKPPRNDQISLHFWDFVVVFIWSGLSKSTCNILPATWIFSTNGVHYSFWT